MGWASGGQIFDNVAEGLIDAQASDDIKRRVLGGLMDSLQQEDWDTEDESLDRFADDPAIVALFAERGIYRHGPACNDGIQLPTGGYYECHGECLDPDRNPTLT